MNNLFEISLEDMLDKPTLETDPKVDTPVETTEIENQENQENLDNTNSNPEPDLDDKSDTADTGDNQDEAIDDRVATVYETLADFVPFEDKPEEVTEDWVREQLSEKLPQKLFMQYADSRPSALQELLVYGSSLTEEDAVEKLSEYFNKYIKPTEVVEINDVTTAREFLQNSKEFKEFIEDDEDREALLDRWEDADKIVSEAKKYQEKLDRKKEASKERVKQEAQQAENQRLTERKKFNDGIKSELESSSWDQNMKQRTVNALNPTFIKQVNDDIKQSPLAVVQLANIYSYFKGGNFNELFELLEGKKRSNKTKETKDSIAKDSLGRQLQKTAKTIQEKDNNSAYVPVLI